MKQELTYTLKVWLTSSVLTPILTTALHFYFLSLNNLHPFYDARIYDKELLRLLKSIALIWVGFLPLAVGLYYSIVLLSKKPIGLFCIKAYLSVIGVILATFFEAILLFDMLMSNTNGLIRTVAINAIIQSIICHTLPVVGSIWFYKLMPTNSIPLKQVPNEI
ncbi:hypothetical protein JN11_01045 [Mucilaginibacter frigoritolerans]|uniref:Uncharacterized protein n=1 Tax=Mucilaginibacter frigoritolerans TaxID=652788 RepID=A0A562UCZ0_9SPHI|nr:hypothetical protein [Mucilaginibacter frigoritolerans]TWJ03499.1 hypothetical protein JN11_01045 [Mucilaginibacter frigoritolerans]